ncbi:ABC transporter permease [Mycoplasma sp. Ms02]|uniref:ABC transporter permease n=1 Tax=Mycoplasma sp. Ms02 TaxID=353851 RepID=UPI001C89DFBA|nr:ABC transporter permease subunit [Mycoplasma sp. Ms02]QZE12443.1 ABC transporter permease subunit [Mycoplasma sp. Ms02]
MNRFFAVFKNIYVQFVLLIVYIPLVVGAIWSFNDNPDKGGFLTTTWTETTTKHWKSVLEAGRDIALVNTIIIAVTVSVIVIFLSLITSYAMYRQKNKMVKRALNATMNIPIINPDNITAIGLVLIFGLLFGIISSDSEGMPRLIAAHTVMALPYGISLMYPRSEKFNNNLFEASQDLGHSKLSSWFKTYFVYMMPSIVMTFVVSTVLSMDDFIITRTVSNTSTLGLKLYEGSFEPWSLVFGAILLMTILVVNVIYVSVKVNATKKPKLNIKKTTEGQKSKLAFELSWKK